MKTETAKLKKAMTQRSKPSKTVPTKDLLSTGSTLLDLSLSGRYQGGFSKGRYFFIVGDSSSGKTFLSLTCLAEASKNPQFDDYRFIFDNAEDGALMDMERYFGKRVAKRLEPPRKEDGVPVFSSTVEEFYYNIDDAFKAGKPFIYVLDSMDALDTEEDEAKFEQSKKASRKGTNDAAGSYGVSKAKLNSTRLRRVLSQLRKSKSILIIISQTRDNIGFGWEKRTRAGGRALKFYATVEIWSSVTEKISKTVNGKKRQIGITCRIQTKKNRLTGKEWTVEMPIFHSFGIDDVGSCVDFLVEEKHWPCSKGIIKADEFNFRGTRDKLIRFIEQEEAELDLRMITGEVWNEIEEACQLKRKRRY